MPVQLLYVGVMMRCKQTENGQTNHGRVLFPKDPITEPQMMIGVYNHLLRKVFRFHYHSQKVIGSLGIGCSHGMRA